MGELTAPFTATWGAVQALDKVDPESKKKTDIELCGIDTAVTLSPSLIRTEEIDGVIVILTQQCKQEARRGNRHGQLYRTEL